MRLGKDRKIQGEERGMGSGIDHELGIELGLPKAYNVGAFFTTPSAPAHLISKRQTTLVLVCHTMMYRVIKQEINTASGLGAN